ncbi:MAG: phosphopantetheine-binding protein [Propionibacteriaceae bacterium]|nr:phosphopantetheine-binding protein [Propionibacteriaceae bacterium]
MDRVRAVILARRSDLTTADIDVFTVLNEAPLSFDSLDLAEFIVGLEHEFGIIAVDQDFAALRTIGDAVAFVESSRKVRG